ncbi:MAG: hypothetical protein ACE5OP_11255 [Candidatus Glassbacteria bacterium]
MTLDGSPDCTYPGGEPLPECGNINVGSVTCDESIVDEWVDGYSYSIKALWLPRSHLHHTAESVSKLKAGQFYII